MFKIEQEKKVQKQVDRYAFSTGNILGTGSYSIVYEGKDLMSGQPVAVKVVNKRLMKNPMTLQNMKKELAILSTLNHQNIIKLLATFQTKNNLYIITQYCQMSLDKLINTQIPFQICQKYILDIMKGLKYLWLNRIVHRDLKLANILIAKGQAKITDFGFATHANQNQVLSEVMGSPLYMSPQLLKRQLYTAKVDIWAFGICFYQMLFGKTPWTGSNQNNLLYNIQNSNLLFPYYRDIPFNIKQLIKKCLMVKEKDRLTFRNLVEWAENYEIKSFKSRSTGVSINSCISHDISDVTSSSNISRQININSPLYHQESMSNIRYYSTKCTDKQIMKGQDKLGIIRISEIIEEQHRLDKKRQYCLIPISPLNLIQ